jgi:hypothetical protein
VKLRCVFYDPDVVDADDWLTERALEACERAGVDVYALVGDEPFVTVGGEEHAIADDLTAIEFVLRASAYEREEAIGVGARLADAPVGVIWVEPADLEVRGPHVRAAEEDGHLLYEAVITELAERR